MHDLKKAFDLLGIEPSTDEKIVRRAWRALVRSYHPDMAKTDPEAANRRLSEINSAFDAVCGCTASEVRQLQDQIARAARIAEERRRAQQLQEQRRRDLARASQRDRAARTEEDRAEAEPEHSGIAPATGTDIVLREPCADTAAHAICPSCMQKAQQKSAHLHLADMAAQAFDAAREVCAPHLREQPRSLYL